MINIDNKIYEQLVVKYQKVIARIISTYSQIITFSNCSIKGYNKISKDLYNENYSYIAPRLQNMVPNSEGVIKKYGSYEQLAAEYSSNITQDSLNQSVIVLESSSIILLHCMLDISLNDLLQITVELEPDYWNKRIDKSDVKYDVFLKHSKDEIIKKRMDKIINKIDRESVIVKCKYLLEICKPLQKKEFIKNYKLDIDLLEEYDNKRHTLIHINFKNLVKNEASIIVNYFKDTALFFCGMIGEKYNFRINANQFASIFPEIAKQPYENVNFIEKEAATN